MKSAKFYYKIFNYFYFLYLKITFTVRQENERLLQESLNRAKYAANYTDPPFIAAATEATFNKYHSNYVP
jgi:hypothetical protein